MVAIFSETNIQDTQCASARIFDIEHAPRTPRMCDFTVHLQMDPILVSPDMPHKMTWLLEPRVEAT